jgi:hypothetical protein
MSYYDNALLAVKTTAPQYLKDATDMTIRRRLILKLLQESGNMIFNWRSPSMTWKVKVRTPKGRAMTAGQRSIFKMHDAYEELTISHASFEVTDKLDRMTQMINETSPNQIIDLAGTKMEDLVLEASRILAEQFYVDASGANSDQFTGVQTFFKAHSSTVSTDIVALPDSAISYGGKSIGLGQFGGFWSNTLTGSYPSSVLAKDWPEGSGSPEYDWNSPKMLKYNGNWGAASNSWANNCTKVLRRGSSYIAHTSGQDMAPIVNVLSNRLYNEFRDNLETRERLNVSDYAKELGFPDIMNYEGALITTDFNCPADRGYGINPAEMALYSVHDSLFFTDGPIWSTPEQSTLLLVGALGNWRYNLRGMIEYRP